MNGYGNPNGADLGSDAPRPENTGGIEARLSSPDPMQDRNQV